MSFPTVAEIGQRLDGFLWPMEEGRQRARRERILRAATELLVQHGYRKTSVDDIALRAGVAKGTVYLYYRNKAELAFHAIALEKRAYLHRMIPVDDPAVSPRERLQAFLAVGLGMVEEMPLLTSLTRGNREIAFALADVDSGVLNEVNDWQTEFLVRLIDEASGGCWPPEQLRTRARVLIDLLFAVVISEPMVADALPRDQYAQVVADVIVNGIVNDPAGTGTFESRTQEVASDG